MRRARRRCAHGVGVLVGVALVAGCGSDPAAQEPATAVSTSTPAPADSPPSTTPPTSAPSTTPPETTTSPTTTPETTTPATTVATTTPETTAPPTTNPPASIPPSDLDWPGLTEAVECSPWCSQILAGPSGALWMKQPTDAELVRVARDGVRTSVDLVGDVDWTDSWILAVGPGDVVYLDVPRAPDGDPIGDVVAVATSGSQAGSIVGEWPDAADRTGDVDYVPTARGLVAVGCCGFDPVRPDPSLEPTVPWVAQDGSPAVGSGPYVTMRTGESGNEFVVVDGTAERRLPLPTVAQNVRGMPWVQPLDDGGLVAAFLDQETGAAFYAVYPSAADGAWSFGDAGELLVHSFFDVYNDLVDGPAMLALLPSGEAVVRVDDLVERIDVSDVGPRLFPAEATPDGWTISADALNDRIGAERPEWATSPELVARTFVLDWYPNERVVIERADASADRSTVTMVVTSDGLLDDSVAASRLTLTLERADDGLFRVVAGERTQRCQPGRGHQDFRPELCV